MVQSQEEFPKISIITPSFNQAEFLEKTIVSVLNQNYPNLEYIIIDGGSKDGSIDILRKYESKIHFWESKKDNGQSHAINKGLSIATGEIATWLNSDDYFLPDTLKKVSDIWKRKPFNYLVGNCYFVDKNDNLLDSQIKSKLINNNEYLPCTNNCIVNQPSSFFSMKIYKELGPLDEKLHYSMDVDFWLKIAAHNYKFEYVDEYYTYFRRHQDAKSAIGNIHFIEDTLQSDFVKNNLKIINLEFYKKVKKSCINCLFLNLRMNHNSAKLFKAFFFYIFETPDIAIKHLFLYAVVKTQLYFKSKN